MKIFQNLYKLRILLFWEILKEQNPLLLYVDFDPEKEYSKDEIDFAETTWRRLYDEYFKARNDAKGRQTLKDNEEELSLLYEIKLLTDIRNHLIYLFECIDTLPIKDYEKLKFSAFQITNKIENNLKFSAFDTVEFAVGKIDRVLNSLNNSYNLKKKRNIQETNKQIENVYKVVANVEQILERSISNINYISVMQWIAYEEIANDKIKSQKDAKNGKR